MGCDIHLYVEVYDEKQQKWISADQWKKDEDGYVSVENGYFDGRSYNTFAILANVRNGRGFAGIDTGNGFNPISSPKGIPYDVSPEVSAKYEDWGGDAHSASYLSAKELLDYDWTQETSLRGQVEMKEYRNWSEFGKRYGKSPESYCGSCEGPGVRHISMAEADQMLKPLNQELSQVRRESHSKYLAKLKEQEASYESVFVSSQWTQKYYQCTTKFLSETMPRLWRLGSPDKVRIVFWFDN